MHFSTLDVNNTQEPKQAESKHKQLQLTEIQVPCDSALKIVHIKYHVLSAEEHILRGWECGETPRGWNCLAPPLTLGHCLSVLYFLPLIGFLGGSDGKESA